MLACVGAFPFRSSLVAKETTVLVRSYMPGTGRSPDCLARFLGAGRNECE